MSIVKNANNKIANALVTFPKGRGILDSAVAFCKQCKDRNDTVGEVSSFVDKFKELDLGLSASVDHIVQLQGFLEDFGWAIGQA